MSSITLILIALCVYALGYRFYSAFIAAKVAVLDDSRVTPAHRLRDGKDFLPMNRIVLFGHHFAAISGAGPLIGPVLAAQFGFLPGTIWLLVGAVLAGAVHDYIILLASVRMNGRSLGEIAREYIGRFSGAVTMLAILFIITTALAGLAIAVVNALSESIWGTFTIAMTIPIALFVGLYLFKFRPGRVAEASIIGVVLVLLAVGLGHPLQNSAWGHYFLLTEKQLKILLPAYGCLASVLPVWLLLAPRDYLSAYLKIGTVLFLAAGIFLVHPHLEMPALTPYIHGGGPIVPGKVWPFVCITIACGAISGFHALVGSGTTPKLVDRESDIRFIGYGAMVAESFVSILALIAACSLAPQDYFAINANPALFPEFARNVKELPELTARVEEQTLVGRTGGAVSFAVGMARIFSSLPFMKKFMDYWYHFSIMFEALFILTTIDAGTRVARFLFQELVEKLWRPRRGWESWLLVIGCSLVVSFAWGYLLFSNDIRNIWPMFGVANQLLGTLALAIGTTFILRHSQKRIYALVTFLPMLFMLATTVTAGVSSILAIYLPQHTFTGNLNAFLCGLMVLMVLLVLGDGVRKWEKVLNLGGHSTSAISPEPL